MCLAPQRRAIFRQFFDLWTLSFLTFWLQNVLLATAACNFFTSQLQKVVRTPQFFDILTSKCASRYSGVQFFNIATSKSGLSPSVFYDFDLKMCLSLQRRAIFPHRNFKKWSEPEMFCTFWLENVLLATAACNFSTSQLQKVVRPRHFFSILTSKCASRYSGVQFFLCPLQSYLRTRRFSEVTFRPSRHTKHWKTQHFATSLTFRACWSSFFPHLLIFFLAALLFQLSILSEVRLLNFLRLLLSWRWFYYSLTISTSSTAQGGGGSFKNRKPIGEIGCCESPMAEQKHWWIELSNCVTD